MQIKIGYAIFFGITYFVHLAQIITKMNLLICTTFCHRCAPRKAWLNWQFDKHSITNITPYMWSTVCVDISWINEKLTVVDCRHWGFLLKTCSEVNILINNGFYQIILKNIFK